MKAVIELMPGCERDGAEDAGRALMRRTLPFVFATPLALAWLRFEGQKRGMYGVEAGIALMAITTVVLLAAVLLWAARWLSRTDIERRRALAESRLYADMVANAQVGLLCYRLDDETDPHSLRLIYANPAAEAATGTKLGDQLGRPLGTIFPTLLATSVPQTYAEVALTGVPRDLGEVVYGDERISSRPFSVKAFPLPQRTVGVAFEDISERKRAEQELTAAKDATEQANKELESFSYSVSHDLRAPLRSIDGFSQALLEDYESLLDAQGKDYLQRVRAATQRMGKLIDDLLGLARVTRTELQRQKVDAAELAREVVEQLRSGEPERSIDVTVLASAPVYADPGLLRILLENLLSNAWKFTNKVTLPRIEFGCSEQDGKRILFVKDNGAGFDAQHADKLFGAFQRLHSMQEFPGNGVGLATVRRIVSRHGGRVWANSELGQGATFYFTLEGAPQP